ncbi:MAG: SPOR domain-containing protein [Cryomorphaceae bacterium]|nr:SPOR domain-containing protein [Cryomorphaceae bacterium]
MKKNYASLTLLCALICFGELQAQPTKDGYFSMGADAGNIFMTNTTHTSRQFFSYKPSIGAQGYLQYHFNDFFSLKGVAFGAFSNGAETPNFNYEGFYGSGDIRISLNLMHLIKKDMTKYRLEAELGGGGMVFTSYLMQRTGNPEPIVNRRVPQNRGSVAFASTYSLALRYQQEVYDGIYFNVGFQYTGTSSPWLDATVGEGNNGFFLPFIGASFSLKRMPKANEINVDRRTYNRLSQDVDRLEQEKNQFDQKIEMTKDESRAVIASLQQELKDAMLERDSAKALADKYKTEGGARDTDASAELWRVVVGSFPNKGLTDRFMARTRLDKSEMEVVYNETLKTYRVIYKSSASLEEARKFRDAARQEVSDAWIIRF